MNRLGEYKAQSVLVTVLAFFVLIGCSQVWAQKKILVGEAKVRARSKCILQLSNLNKLAISYGKIYEVKPGGPLAPSILVDIGLLPVLYKCPAGGTYKYTNKMPTEKDGTKPYAQCNVLGHTFDPYESNSK